jgi:putative protein kinase ArgK-like GTPase of G3E family
MVDFFVIVKGADELQGIKRGIMEMADTIVINKADGDNIRKAQLAKSEFNRRYLFPAKVRLDYNCNLQCNYTRRNSMGNHHEIYRTHEKQ